ncbi:amino acid transporter heavy chain SLC3A2 [Antennarius striatus]|uniref:amino acid transporter heavy chain SLC3A2 n=1 Tax=Antennarius striatus TaxID=241820 RepID=UPI0035B05E14
MPLNTGEPGYGGAQGAGLAASLGHSESAPMLVPEWKRWQPLSKEELAVVAGGPGWRRVRFYLLLLFWVSWLAMLAVAIAIILLSPRPVVTPLSWFQKSVFLQLKQDVLTEQSSNGSGDSSALCEQLPYLSHLGIGAVILGGLYDRSPSLNLTDPDVGSRSSAQMQHFLSESNKVGLKVVLDLCQANVAENANESSNLSATEHVSLRFWLEKGVAGFAICDTDAAFSEETLLEWRGIFEEFSTSGRLKCVSLRIIVVKQMQDVLSPVNISLVDMVMRTILPSSSHLLSANEVVNAIETNMQVNLDVWPSWTVGGKASPDLKKLLVVLLMTVPGSPAFQTVEEIEQTQNMPLKDSDAHGQTNGTVAVRKTRSSAVALFNSLSHSRAREEALQYGSFTFLPVNSSIQSSSNSTLASLSSPPILAFLRSWGCVHFLILLNTGSERHALDPTWAASLPETGVFVISTEMDRLGSTTLHSLELRPHEAVVIKLFDARSYA